MLNRTNRKSSSLRSIAALLLLAPLAALAQPFIDPMYQITANTHIYTSTAQTTGGPVDLAADVYTPDGVSGDLLPGILFVPGSGLTGNKGQPIPVAVASGFAQRGYVAAAIDYRTAATVPTNEPGPFDSSNPTERQINAVFSDTTMAVQWFRQNAAQWNLDPNRIILAGSSAGALVAMMVAYEELGAATEVAAVLDLWGSMSGTISGGGQTTNLGDQTTLIDANDPALFMVHGTADPVVPFAEAQALQARALAVGLEHELVAIDGAGHSPSIELFADPQPGPTYFQQAVNFMYTALDLDEVAVVPTPPVAPLLLMTLWWISRRRTAVGAGQLRFAAGP